MSSSELHTLQKAFPLLRFGTLLDFKTCQIALEIFSAEPEKVQVKLLGVQILNQAGECNVILPGVQRQLVVGNNKSLALGI